MTSPDDPERALGRRAAHKEATRDAVREAAKQLFAERGYAATTVREIAAAAGVTERTFYRYFDGKEGLIGEETLAWIEILCAAIVARPAEEPPLRAALEALLGAAGQARSGVGPAPVWLLSEEGRPLGLARRASPRMLVHFEDSIAAAFVARAEARGEPASALEAELLARVTVAILRTAVIERRRHGTARPSAAATRAFLEGAFALAARAAGDAAEPSA